LNQTVKGKTLIFKTLIFAPTGAGGNIADELDARCLVTNQ
jgi:hypothetical protein